MQLIKGMEADDSTYRALSLILEAWDEGTESGVPPEQMAYAAIYTALTDLVSQYGEDAVVKLARGLEERIKVGEFTLHRTRQ
jgi:transcription initiation factor TFIIIB Brf1 subunit/transcription initiation factor TFIIB